MRSYVVNRFPHFKHSRRRRMESASLLSRESTTLSFSNPQKGHFMALLACRQYLTGLRIDAGCVEARQSAAPMNRNCNSYSELQRGASNDLIICPAVSLW